MQSLPARRRAGFTLLEIITVLLVLGILAGIAVASIGGATSAADVRRVEEALVSDLRVARMRAMGCGAGSIKLQWDAKGWRIKKPPCGRPISVFSPPEEEDDWRGVEHDPGSGNVVFTYPWGGVDKEMVIKLGESSGACRRRVVIKPDSGRIKSESCGG
ncbi:MAG: Tfp pilus assembly protein FimT/FimU [Halorhodospira sp.]